MDADGCTACRLHCRISQSVWAANDLKIEGMLPKAKAGKLAWFSHASSEMSRTRGPIPLSYQRECMRKPSICCGTTRMHSGSKVRTMEKNSKSRKVKKSKSGSKTRKVEKSETSKSGSKSRKVRKVEKWQQNSKSRKVRKVEKWQQKSKSPKSRKVAAKFEKSKSQKTTNLQIPGH